MFVSYARKDAALQSELETVLKRLRSDELIQVIQASTTETISPGDDWKGSICNSY